MHEITWNGIRGPETGIVTGKTEDGYLVADVGNGKVVLVHPESFRTGRESRHKQGRIRQPYKRESLFAGRLESDSERTFRRRPRAENYPEAERPQ